MIKKILFPAVMGLCFFLLLFAGYGLLIQNELPTQSFVFQVVSYRGKPLNRATLIYNGPMRGLAKARHNGLVRLKKIPQGVYRVSVYSPGYQPFNQELMLSSQNSQKSIRITLQRGEPVINVAAHHFQFVPGVQKPTFYNYSTYVDEITITLHHFDPARYGRLFSEKSGMDVLRKIKQSDPLAITQPEGFSPFLRYRIGKDGTVRTHLLKNQKQAYAQNLGREFILDDLPPGLYWAEIQGRALDYPGKVLKGDPKLFLVSPVTVFSKQSYDRQIFYGANIASNTPVERGTVLLFKEPESQGSNLIKVFSGGLNQGQVEASVQNSRGWVVLIDDKQNLALQPFSAYYNSGWEENNNVQLKRPVSTFITTERPLYRPGDEIMVKGISYERSQAGWQPFNSPKKILVQLANPEYEIMATQSVTVKDGGFDTVFKLPANAPVGEYRIQSELGYASLRVEEYKKPKYQIRVVSNRSNALVGDNVQFTVKGNYFFGAPLAGATLRYTLYSRYHYSWIPWWAEDDESNYYGYDYGYGDVVKNGEAVLDEGGAYTLDFKIPAQEHERQYVLEVEVADESGKYVPGSGAVVGYPFERRITAYSENWTYAPGDKPQFYFEVRDYQNKPVASEVWVTLKKENKGTVVFDGKVAVDQTGKLRWSPDVSLSAQDQEGWQYYRLTAQTRDSRGKVVSTTSGFYVYAGKNANDNLPQFDRTARVQIKLDKSFYLPGDKAQCFIFSTQEMEGLLTLEGNDIEQSRWVKIKKGVNQFEYRVTEKLMPYSAVVFNYFENTHLQQTYARLRMNQVALKKLDIKITPSKDHYEPGETAKIKIETLNQQGRGVGSRLSVAVVDEPIFQLAGRTNTDLFSFFYKRRYTLVNTSFHHWGLGGYDYYGGGAKELSEIVPRKNFKDVAYYNPDLSTGMFGSTTIQFKVPDNLTSWRITALGYNANAQFGDARAFATVRKPLMIESNLPRFFREDDRSEISAMIFNQSDNAIQGQAQIEAQGLPQSIQARQNFELKSQTRKKIQVGLTIPRLADDQNLKITVKASAGNLQDGEEQSLPLIPRKFPYQAWRLPFTDIPKPTALKFDYHLPPVDLKKMEDFKFKAYAFNDPTFLMLPAIKYLVQYPYGCVEQTMSSFLPNLLVQKIIKTKGFRLPEIEKKLPGYHEVALKKLVDYQHGDGGWGVWKDDDTDLWHTAYVLYGLHLAQQNGVAVPPGVIARGLKNLRRQLTYFYYQPYSYFYGSSDGMTVMPFAVWVAGIYQKFDSDFQKNVLPLLEQQFLKPAGDSIHARVQTLSYLVRIYRGVHNQTLEDKYSKMLIRLQKPGGGFKNPQEDEFYWYSSDAEETAEAILALAPRSDTAPVRKALQYLVQQSRNGYWQQTRATAKSIYALALLSEDSRYFKKGKSVVTIKLNQKKLGEYSIQGGQNIEFPLSDKNTPQNGQIEIETRGGSLYLAMALEGIFRGKLDQPYLLPATTLPLTQRFYKKSTAGSADGWAEVLTPHFKMGDNVKIVMEVNPDRDLHDVVIEMPLPAGLTYMGLNSSNWGWYYREEKRSDRILYFFKNLPQGRFTLEAVVQAQTPGVYSMPPAIAQCMYRPDIFGSTLEQTVKITP